MKILRAAGILALLGVLLALPKIFPVARGLESLLGWVQGMGVWGPVLLGVAYVLACVLFIPGFILSAGAGFVFGLVRGGLTISVASTLGATAAFLVGRTLLRGWVERKVSRDARFAAIDAAVGREGFRIVLLTRLSPVFPFNLLNYAYGVTKVPLGTYVLASWIGMAPGTVMYVYLGSAARSLSDIVAGNLEGGVGQKVLLGVGLAATVVVTAWVTRIARRALAQEVLDGCLGPPA